MRISQTPSGEATDAGLGLGFLLVIPELNKWAVLCLDIDEDAGLRWGIVKRENSSRAPYFVDGDTGGETRKLSPPGFSCSVPESGPHRLPCAGWKFLCGPRC